MSKQYIGILVLALIGVRGASADNIQPSGNDTIRTYNMNEVIITSSPKETNDLRTLPGSVSNALCMVPTVRIGGMEKTAS